MAKPPKNPEGAQGAEQSATAATESAGGDDNKPLAFTIEPGAAPKKPAPAASEVKYSAAELAAAAQARFGVQPEIAAAALRNAGKDCAAVTEAASIIKEFASRRVT